MTMSNIAIDRGCHHIARWGCMSRATRSVTAVPARGQHTFGEAEPGAQREKTGQQRLTAVCG